MIIRMLLQFGFEPIVWALRKMSQGGKNHFCPILGTDQHAWVSMPDVVFQSHSNDDLEGSWLLCVFLNGKMDAFQSPNLTILELLH